MFIKDKAKVTARKDDNVYVEKRERYHKRIQRDST